MTCGKCKYEYCWMCMGDFKNHEKETGIFLCSTYANVVKIGRGSVLKDQEKNEGLARELQMINYFSTRYQEH